MGGLYDAATLRAQDINTQSVLWSSPPRGGRRERERERALRWLRWGGFPAPEGAAGEVEE
eukprot:7092760-Prorocentrum_lima.AAC.1